METAKFWFRDPKQLGGSSRRRGRRNRSHDRQNNLGGEFYCREYCLTLDLTKYREARWWVEEPKLTIRSFDEKEKEYSSAVTVEPARGREGQWTWEIADIQNKVGVPKNRWNVVVHVSWNVRAPVSLENP